MKKLEFSAKSISDALSLASQHFDIAEDKIEYEVIQEAAKGILGIGAKDCIISARVSTPALIQNYVEKMLEKMDFPSQADVTESEDGSLHVELTSEFAGAIIGRRGETLDAIQYLTTLFLNRFNSEDQYTRVNLDIENYRAKREQALIRLANGVAAKVIRSRRDVVLEPMNPLERRIIHSALQNNDKVASHSIGSEPHRKIVVTLA